MTSQFIQSSVKEISNMMSAKPNLCVIPQQLQAILDFLKSGVPSIHTAAMYKLEGARLNLLCFNGTQAPPEQLEFLTVRAEDTILQALFYQNLPTFTYCLRVDETYWGSLVLSFQQDMQPVESMLNDLDILSHLISNLITQAYAEDQINLYSQIAHALNDIDEMAQLIPLLIRKLHKYIRYDTVLLTMNDPYQPNWMKGYIAHTQEDSSDATEIRLSYDHSSTEERMTLRNTYYGVPTQHIEDDYVASCQSESIRSVIRIPLIHQDSSLGVLHLYSHYTDHFLEKEAYELNQLMDQFLPAFQHVSLTESRNYQAHFSRTVQILEEKVFNQNNWYEGSRKVSKITQRLLELDDILVWYMDFEQLILRNVMDESLNFSFTDSSIVANVFFQKKSIYYNDIEDLSYVSEHLAGYKVKSVLICPLIDNASQIIGIALMVDQNQSNRFNDAFCELCDQYISPKGARVGIEMSHYQLRQTNLAMIKALTIALDKKDAETQGHSERVVQYTLAIARQLKLSEMVIEQIRWGALLHDIGKIGIPDAILLKPGKLTSEEWEIMRTHPELGFEMLKDIKFLEDSLDIVLYHHERLDGKGYPYHLTGEEIPIGARIFAIADTFDAITSDRPYRKAQSIQTARAIIAECTGTQFCHTCVEAFMQIPDSTLQHIKENYHQVAQ